MVISRSSLAVEGSFSGSLSAKIEVTIISATPQMTFGEGATATGENSASIGIGTTASANEQIVVGKYNDPSKDDNKSFVVGNGYYNSNSDSRLNNVFSAGSDTDPWGRETDAIMVRGYDPMIKLRHEPSPTSTDVADSLIVVKGANEYGNNMLVQAGGNLILGGGEYPANRYNAGLGTQATGENTFIGADESLYIETNGQTITDRKTWTFGSDGNLITQGYISLRGNTTTTTPTANRTYNELQLCNTDGVRYGQVGTAYFTDGRRGITLEGINNGTGSNVYNTLRLMVDGSGTRSVILDQTSWRNALGYNELTVTGTSIGKGDTVSVPSGAWTTVGEMQFTQGLYLITIVVPFATNNTGRREIGLSVTQNSSPDRGHLWQDKRNAVNGQGTYARMSGLVNIGASGQTLYVNACQNSGSALNTYPRWSCVRLK